MITNKKLNRKETEKLCLEYDIQPFKKLNMFKLCQELNKKGIQINCQDYERKGKNKNLKLDQDSEEIIIDTNEYLRIKLKGLNYEIVQMKNPREFYPNGFEEKILAKGKFVKSFIDNNSVLLKVEGKNSYILGAMNFTPPCEIVEFKNSFAIDTAGNLYLFNKGSVLNNDNGIVTRNFDINDPEKLYWTETIRRCSLGRYLHYF